MQTLIKNLLNIPVYEPHETITFPSATIDSYQVNADCFGDGQPVSEMENIKIDLWYKDKEERIRAAFALRHSLADNFDITYPDINFSFDTNARCYRATLSFSKRR